ncbi:MAG: DUF488 domain-containing protein [Gammaproteobacteria bacterium]|nr:DUF488 domain-containing protein [Gammaproteobacteria bacterium]
MGIKLKRAYEPPAGSDGQRILVDRLWPRGLSKEKAAVDEWIKEVAPSNELRRWFAHDPRKWPEFQKRYLAELQDNPALAELRKLVRKGTTTLVYSARDEEHNQAVVLKQALEHKG